MWPYISNAQTTWAGIMEYHSLAVRVTAEERWQYSLGEAVLSEIYCRRDR